LQGSPCWSGGKSIALEGRLALLDEGGDALGEIRRGAAAAEGGPFGASCAASGVASEPPEQALGAGIGQRRAGGEALRQGLAGGVELAAGTTRLSSPSSSARCASMRSASSISSAARLAPTRRGRKYVLPPSAVVPSSE
jgi:hypothetical protein